MTTLGIFSIVAGLITLLCFATNNPKITWADFVAFGLAGFGIYCLLTDSRTVL